MLHISISYKTLLRIAGLLLVAYGLFWVVSALFVQITVVGDQQYAGPLLFWDSGEILAYIFYGLPLLGVPAPGSYFAGFSLPGPLLYVGVGLCLLVLSMRRPRLLYWSLQVLLWSGSMSFWSGLAFLFSELTNQTGINVPGSFALYFWITLACSLVLLAAYRPVVGWLKKFCKLPAMNAPEMEVLSVMRTKG